MRMRTWAPAGLVGLALLFGVGHSDPPQEPHDWMSFRGSPARTMDWSDPQVQPPFQLKWVFWGRDSGTKGALLAVDGIIIFPNVGRWDGGNIYAVDAETGEMIWKQYVRGPYVVSLEYSDGLIFFPEHSRGLLAFELTTGQVAWTRADLGGNASPLAAAGMVFTTERAAEDVLHAVNATTGQDVWTKQGVSGGLSFSDGLLVVRGNTYVAALDVETGEEEWRTSIPETALAEFYQPIIADGVVYVPHHGALRLTDGSTIWSGVNFRGYGGGIVFAYVSAWDASDGTLLWSSTKQRMLDMAGDICTAPIYHDGTIYYGTGFGGTLLGVETFFAVEASTGDVLWRWKTGGVTCSSPVIYGGKIYFGSADRGLYCFEPMAEGG